MWLLAHPIKFGQFYKNSIFGRFNEHTLPIKVVLRRPWTQGIGLLQGYYISGWSNIPGKKFQYSLKFYFYFIFIFIFKTTVQSSICLIFSRKDLFNIIDWIDLFHDKVLIFLRQGCNPVLQGKDKQHTHTWISKHWHNVYILVHGQLTRYNVAGESHVKKTTESGVYMNTYQKHRICSLKSSTWLNIFSI